MLGHLRPSILALAVFAGYIVPIPALWWLTSQLALEAEASNVASVRLFAVAIFIVRFGGSVLAGYLAARLSRIQPLLHGLVASVLGATFKVVFAQEGALLFGVSLVAGLAGAVLSKVRRL